MAQFASFGPFFSNGALVAGARIYHYSAGTSTFKDAYIDAGTSTTAPNPLTADSQGIASAYFNGPYKIVVKDASDSTLYTWDHWGPSLSVAGENGSWTPDVGGNATYISQLGSYTKINNVVTIQCRLIIGAIGTGDKFQISGLPYPSKSIYFSTFPLFFANAASSVVYAIAYIDPATPSVVKIGSMTAAGVSNSAFNPFMGDVTFVCFSGSYLTDD